MSGHKPRAVATLLAALDRDPEELDPLDMIEYLRGAMRAATRQLGVTLEEPEVEEPEYPTHGEQVARPNGSDYLGGDLTMRAGW